MPSNHVGVHQIDRDLQRNIRYSVPRSAKKHSQGYDLHSYPIGRQVVSDNSGALLRAKMYGENDLSSNELFSGNFINFGYWRNFKRGRHLSIDERTQSQANLYRVVLDSLNITPTDVALEVGCGIGVGAVLALREYEPRGIHGLDLSRDQLDRAMRVTGELVRKWRNRLIFCQGSALALPYADEKFDKCYSVEAAQHFDDLPKFAAEAYRVIKSSGRLSVTTFFMPPTAAIDKLRRMISLRRVSTMCASKASASKFGMDLTLGWRTPTTRTAGPAIG
jgi:ubiquinone/menaquinone biosynthesis C-methylase UbiE